jgi:radical SAM superfamily enzyme YgiQ (UPF0313 family)
MKNQKVVLIYPNFMTPIRYDKSDPYAFPVNPPMALLCLAAYIKKHGYDVEVINSVVDENFLGKVQSSTKNALAVGITSMTFQLKEALEAAETAKSNGAITILGGPHTALFPEQTCRDDAIDFVVHGEGEKTLLELLNEIKSEENFKKIKGLLYKNGKNVVINDPRENLDMNELPIPAYDTVDMAPFLNIITEDGKKEKLCILESSRGCPHRCSFCINVLTNNVRYRAKNPEKVLNEIKTVIERYNVSNIAFLDDNFFVSRKRVKDICELIIKNGLKIRWDASCRADYFKEGHIDNEILNLMKKSGCVSLRIGAESGSQRILNLMLKDITPEDIINSAKQSKKFGIRPTYSFMLGIPSDRKKDMMMTVAIIKKISKIHSESFFGICCFRPYPGGSLYQMCVEKGYFTEPKELRDWLKPEYEKMYTMDIPDLLWSEDAKLAINIAHYGNLASKKFYLLLKKKMNLSRAIHMLFVLMAKARWKTNFFYLPIDKYIFYKLKTKYLSGVHR